jgi:hypothetical protein
MRFHGPPPSAGGDSGAGDIGPIKFQPFAIEPELAVVTDVGSIARAAASLVQKKPLLRAFEDYEKEKNSKGLRPSEQQNLTEDQVGTKKLNRNFCIFSTFLASPAP